VIADRTITLGISRQHAPGGFQSWPTLRDEVEPHSDMIEAEGAEGAG
jgi:hypothetical protein